MSDTYTCIICPQSCRLLLTQQPDGTYTITGNRCKRGEAYAINEHTRPVRMLTTTVGTQNSPLRRLPVISSGPVPKDKLYACLDLLYTQTAKAPMEMGDILMKNILDTGVDIMAARSLPDEKG